MNYYSTYVHNYVVLQLVMAASVLYLVSNMTHDIIAKGIYIYSADIFQPTACYGFQSAMEYTCI